MRACVRACVHACVCVVAAARTRLARRRSHTSAVPHALAAAAAAVTAAVGGAALRGRSCTHCLMRLQREGGAPHAPPCWAALLLHEALAPARANMPLVARVLNDMTQQRQSPALIFFLGAMGQCTSSRRQQHGPAGACGAASAAMRTALDRPTTQARTHACTQTDASERTPAFMQAAAAARGGAAAPAAARRACRRRFPPAACWSLRTRCCKVRVGGVHAASCSSARAMCPAESAGMCASGKPEPANPRTCNLATRTQTHARMSTLTHTHTHTRTQTHTYTHCAHAETTLIMQPRRTLTPPQWS